MRSSSARISGCVGGSLPGERQQLADVHALVAHALDAHDHVQQRRDERAGRRRPGAWRASSERIALMDLEVAPVDAVVVGDHDRRELDVLVGERLERAIELLEDDVDRRRARAPRARAARPGSGCGATCAGAEGAVDMFLASAVGRPSWSGVRASLRLSRIEVRRLASPCVQQSRAPSTRPLSRSRKCSGWKR